MIVAAQHGAMLQTTLKANEGSKRPIAWAKVADQVRARPAPSV